MGLNQSKPDIIQVNKDRFRQVELDDWKKKFVDKDKENEALKVELTKLKAEIRRNKNRWRDLMNPKQIFSTFDYLQE